MSTSDSWLPVRDQKDASEDLGGDVWRKGGWSGVPVSDTSEEGPSVEVHSIEIVAEVTSEEAVRVRTSIWLSFTPEMSLAA
jgi:hypothetical protein